MGNLLSALSGIIKPQETEAKTSSDSIKVAAEEWCAKKWDENKSSYLVYHQLVWQSLLMYAGLLWISWDRTRRMLMVSTPDDGWTPQPNVNRFSPAIDSIASILQMPEIEAIPREEDDMDAHDIAAVANVIADWSVQQAGLNDDFKSQEDKVGNARQLFVLAGTVFTIVEPDELDVQQVAQKEPKPAWGVQCPQCDTYTKLPVPDAQPAPSDMLMGQQVSPLQPATPPETCPMCNGPVTVNDTTTQVDKIDPETGEPAMEDMTRWGCKVRIGNPLFALPRPGSTNQNNAGWLIWAERMTIDEIASEWDFQATPDSEYVDGGAFQYETQLSYWYTGYSSQQKSSQDSCMVQRFFVEPGKVKEFPDGLYAVRINQQIIEAKSWSDAFCEGPITKGDYLKLPTVYMGRSVAFDLMEIQRELNRYEALIALHAMTSAASPIVADELTKVSEITGRCDKVIWYRSLGPGAKEPHRMAHGQLDEGVYEQRQKLEDQMQNISGAVQVFRGEQPGSVTTASGIAQLRGQAEQMFNVPMANWSAMWRETVRKMVHILQKKMPAWQIVELMGEGHDVQISKFQNADLDKSLEWAAGRFGLPRTRDERRQELMSLYDQGALDASDPSVKQTIFELFGDIGMESQFNLDATRARKENQDMKAGKPARVMPEIEDLATHAAIHKEQIKSLDFDNWPPVGQELLLQHTLETVAALAMLNAPPPQAEGHLPKPNGAAPGGEPARAPGNGKQSGGRPPGSPPKAPTAPPAGPPPGAPPV